MSASIAIPMTPTSGAAYRGSQTSKAAASSSSSYSSSPQTTPSPTVQKQNMFHGRRPSLLSTLLLGPSRSPSLRQLGRFGCQIANTSLGTAISKQECTVINIGDPDGPPRLVSHVVMHKSTRPSPLLTLSIALLLVFKSRISLESRYEGYLVNARQLTDNPPQRSSSHPMSTAITSRLRTDETLSTILYSQMRSPRACSRNDPWPTTMIHARGVSTSGHQRCPCFGCSG